MKATQLEPSADNYFDDCHFSEAGASRLADLVQVCLLGQGLVKISLRYAAGPQGLL